jgi:acyl-CoA synthetase (AMP-forming)/AMP-acid ligase II
MAQALSAAGAAVMIGDIRDDVGKHTAEDLRSGGGTAGRGRGAKVAILSGNDPVAFSCVFGISRAGAVWCAINPRNEAAENRELLDLFDCVALMYQRVFDPLVAAIRPDLRKLRPLVCLDGTGVDVVSFDD